MVNNGVVIGGVIATVAIVFAVFVSFNSISENNTGELIVTNGDYGQTVGEVTGIERSYESVSYTHLTLPTTPYV